VELVHRSLEVSSRREGVGERPPHPDGIRRRTGALVDLQGFEQRGPGRGVISLLYTAGQPDPDLLIRTSGEMRISNFLLWQIAYSEIWVTETLWPDFRRRDLLDAVVAYQKRDRRYGGIKPSPVAVSAK
jgi:hypothetical protein